MIGKRFSPGQVYVALSRVKSLTGLHIVNFDANAIRKSILVDDEMCRLQTKLQSFPCASHVTLVLLNVRSIVADIEADFELQSADVLCFCETWLSPSPVVKADHVILRCDRPHNDHKGGSMPTHFYPSTFASNGIESIQGQVLQVAVVYRAPIVSMQLHMTTLIHHVTKQSNRCYG